MWSPTNEIGTTSRSRTPSLASLAIVSGVPGPIHFTGPVRDW